MSQKINLTKHIIAASLLLFSAMAIVSCEKNVFDPPKVDLTTPVSFQNEIIPIFANNCTSCHGGSLNPDLRAANAYESLTNGGYINTNNPESSLIYSKLLTSPHDSKCTITERNKILAWITQGAKENDEPVK